MNPSLGDYSVRRKLDGSWTFGDRWEILYQGRDWLSAPRGLLPGPASGGASSTRRGAIRKARRLVRLRLNDHAQTLGGAPLADLRGAEQ